MCKSEQVCAVGSAIAAATAAGCYKSIPEAQEKMASGSSTSYQPSAEAAKVYDELYKRYQELAAKTEQMYSHM